MNREDVVFPFTAVVGQDEVKLALLLNSISEQVGGVLIRGRRGTAKSTLARGLAQLLPEMEVSAGCPFSCDPSDIESLCEYCATRLATEGSLPAERTRMKMVTLPLNATEEMVVGTLDIEKALRHGEKGFEPGILARANRSVLYVDEVNLLEDHIVDMLLDSAAMGVNVVEREGISFRHGAHFILLGTMNPDEGDLRPQLEDRFGLCAEVDNDVGRRDRAEILRRNLQFNRNPLEFESVWHPEQEALCRRIIEARERYRGVEVPEGVLEIVAHVTHGAGTDGHRADIAMLNAARALAAFEGHKEVDAACLSRVAPLALNHRLSKGKLGISTTDMPDPTSLIREARAATACTADGNEQDGLAACVDQTAAAAGRLAEAAGHAPTPGEPPAPDDRELRVPEHHAGGPLAGRRERQDTGDRRGRYYRSATPAPGREPRTASEIALDATIRASASRGGGDDGRPKISAGDIKVKRRKQKRGTSIIFVVDASASMGAQRRLDESRDAVLSLLVEAYQKRDRVGLIVFKDDSAQLVLNPTSSPALARRLLEKLTPGGTTPLSHGLALACQVMDRELARNPQPGLVLVLISDGGGNVTVGSSDPMSEALMLAREIGGRGAQCVVIDSSPAKRDGTTFSGRLTAARRIADAMGGSYFHARNLTSYGILENVGQSAPTAKCPVP